MLERERETSDEQKVEIREPRKLHVQIDGQKRAGRVLGSHYCV